MVRDVLFGCPLAALFSATAGFAGSTGDWPVCALCGVGAILTGLATVCSIALATRD